MVFIMFLTRIELIEAYIIIFSSMYRMETMFSKLIGFMQNQYKLFELDIPSLTSSFLMVALLCLFVRVKKIERNYHRVVGSFNNMEIN